jgi:hypothetical protein
MTPEQQDALRQYLACIIDVGACSGDYLNDSLHTLAELGTAPMILMLIQVLGWLLAMIGGF